jgi:glycosyltransferase involved in cell wall biosynthesis
MEAAVIVSTYEAPHALELVLAGLARQSLTPGQVVVADDGSGPDTAAVIARWSARLSCPLLHVWQPDEGFRKMRICNEAVRQTRAERVIFLDGDAVPHRHFVADHLADHRRADVLCGRRVRLGPQLSARVDTDMVLDGVLERWFGPTLLSALRGETRRFTLGLRLPRLLARIFHPRPRKLMGVNFSITRRVFEAVNGYAHDAPARREDRELELRLLLHGTRFAALLNRAVVYHLHHPENAPAPDAEPRLCRVAAQGRSRCADGLAQLAPTLQEPHPA